MEKDFNAALLLDLNFIVTKRLQCSLLGDYVMFASRMCRCPWAVKRRRLCHEEEVHGHQRICAFEIARFLPWLQWCTTSSSSVESWKVVTSARGKRRGTSKMKGKKSLGGAIWVKNIKTSSWSDTRRRLWDSSAACKGRHQASACNKMDKASLWYTHKRVLVSHRGVTSWSGFGYTKADRVTVSQIHVDGEDTGTQIFHNRFQQLHPDHRISGLKTFQNFSSEHRH